VRPTTTITTAARRWQRDAADKIRAAIALLTEVADELDGPKPQGDKPGLTIDLDSLNAPPDPEAHRRMAETRKAIVRTKLGDLPEPDDLR
jgi:hypothetical protein